MPSPYAEQGRHAFWRTAVVPYSPETIEGLYRPKFHIGPEDRVATAGTCFSLEFHRRLREAGLNLLDAEPPPRGLAGDDLRRFGYGMFSARYGNIYVGRHLLQVVREAYGEWAPANPVWWRDGRCFDAMRPAVEPHGLASAREVEAMRRQHLAAVRSVLESATVFVFTMGLTESWMHRASGTVYPTAPGTLAGVFNERTYAFKNFRVQEIVDDFLALRALVHRVNPAMKFLLMVSPMPLTATARPEHVLLATTESKATLRVAAGQLVQDLPDVDYFPAYELIASPFAAGRFYGPNQRFVTTAGVDVMMRVFALGHGLTAADALLAPPPPADELEADEPRGPVCEEALLDAFAR